MPDHRLMLEVLAERHFAMQKIPDVLKESREIFPVQARFIEDPHDRKVIFCTRRAAKSFTAGLYLIYMALKYPGSNNLFIALTRDSAEEIVWEPILKKIQQKYQIDARFNATKLRMVFANGSRIRLVGVDKDEDEMKKLLGRKHKLICIDESSMYTINLANLIDLIEPATIDEKGTICLMGTASNFPRGIFFDIASKKRKDWKLYEWSAYDNPYVSAQWAQAIEKIRRERPEYIETPQYKQWYLNQWEVDETKLVYRFNIEKNIIKHPPIISSALGWVFILGVDTGWNDDSAFVLSAYHEHDPHLYILTVFRKKAMIFDEVADKIQEYMRHSEWAPHKIIIDGANKQGVESMRVRSAIPFEYAEKHDKATFIELCNSDLIQGKILIVDNSENRQLWEQMSSLVWVTDGDKIKYPKKEHPSLPNDLCDSFLYNWRCGYHYAFTIPAKKIVKYSREYYQRQSEGIWENERERLTESENDWPQMGNLGNLG